MLQPVAVRNPNPAMFRRYCDIGLGGWPSPRVSTTTQQNPFFGSTCSRASGDSSSRMPSTSWKVIQHTTESSSVVSAANGQLRSRIEPSLSACVTGRLWLVLLAREQPPVVKAMREEIEDSRSSQHGQIARNDAEVGAAEAAVADRHSSLVAKANGVLASREVPSGRAILSRARMPATGDMSACVGHQFCTASAARDCTNACASLVGAGHRSLPGTLATGHLPRRNQSASMHGVHEIGEDGLHSR